MLKTNPVHGNPKSLQRRLCIRHNHNLLLHTKRHPDFRTPPRNNRDLVPSLLLRILPDPILPLYHHRVKIIPTIIMMTSTMTTTAQNSHKIRLSRCHQRIATKKSRQKCQTLIVLRQDRRPVFTSGSKQLISI
jgi:hypothetical protein